MSESLSKRMLIYGWLVCILAALFYCYEYLLRIEPSVMIPALKAHFAISSEGLGILVGMYYFAYTPMQIVVGVVLDYYGVRRVLTGAVLLCVVGSFLFVITHQVVIAAIGRFLIGVGSSFAFVGVLKLAASWLPRNRFAFFVGITTLLGMAGAIFGDVVLSWLVTTVGWRLIMLHSALVGLVLAPLFYLLLGRKTPVRMRKKHVITWRETLATLKKLVVHREIILAGVIGGILYLSMSVIAELWGVNFIHTLTHLTKTESADLNALIFFGWMVGSPISGWLSDHLKTRRWLLIVGSLLAAFTFTLVLFFPHLPDWAIGTLLFLFGVFGSVEVLVFAVGHDIISLKFVATAVALINLLTMLGGLIFQPLTGVLIKNIAPQAEAYQIALGLVPLMMLVAAGLAFFMRETYGTEQKI